MQNMLTFCYALVLRAFFRSRLFVIALVAAMHACVRIVNSCKKMFTSRRQSKAIETRSVFSSTIHQVMCML